MDDPFADVAQPAPAPAPVAPDPFADVAQPAMPTSAPAGQFAQLQSRLAPLNASVPSLGRNTVVPPAATDQGALSGFLTGVGPNTLNMGGRGLISAWDAINHGLESAMPGITGGAADTSRAYADQASQAVEGAIQDRQDANQAHTGAMQVGGLIGGLGTFMLPGVGVPLASGIAGGNRYQDVRDQGGSDTKAGIAGIADAGLNALVPTAAGALSRASAPLAGSIMGAIAPTVGDATASRVAGALLGAGENTAITAGQNVGEAAINAGVNGNLDSFQKDALGDPNAMLGFAGLGALLGARGHAPVSGTKPAIEPIGKPGLDLSPEASAAFDRQTDPFADVAVDQTIRPAPDGAAIPDTDAANLRLPEPAPAEPSQEAVAADSTPEADARANTPQDPLDAFEPEQIGELGRASGGEETVPDMSAVEENRRRLAEMDAAREHADMTTAELPPPVEDPRAETPTEHVPEVGGADFKDALGESGQQEPRSGITFATNLPHEEVQARRMLPKDGDAAPKAPEAAPALAGPDYSHLSPEAQEYLRGEPKFDKEGRPYPKVTPETLAHPTAQEFISDRKGANDAAGDLGNVAQGIQAAQSKIDRAAKLAAKGLKPEVPVAKRIPDASETPTERDIRPVSGPDKLSPGDRANPEPRLSLKSEDPVARDAEKVLQQDRKPTEPKAQEPLRQEARDQVAKEGAPEVAKRLLEKHAKGEAWTQEDFNAATASRDHFIRTEGLGQNTREMQEAMNAQAAKGGQFLANLRDRVQTPEQRHMEAKGVASTATPAKAKILQNLLQEQAQDKAEHTRAKRTAPYSEAPAAKSLKSANAQAKAKLDEELPKLVEEFKKSLRSPGTNALGGRQAEALYNLLENRVKAGVHSFVDLVKSLKKDVPDISSNKDVQESVEQGWERLRQDHPDMGEGGRIDSTLRGIDYAARAKSLEARMAARDKKIEAIRSGIEKDSQALQKYLKARGYDLDDPKAKWLEDPARFGDFMAHVDAAKGGIPAILSNGYIGALHASFAIPAVKVATDADALISDALVRHVEGLVRVATFRPNALRELGAFWKTAPGATAQAAKNTMESLWHERAVGPGSEHEVYGAPSPFTVKMGMAGTILRQASGLPLVRGINSGVMTYAAMTDAAAWAVRSAKGLKGQDLEDHIQREISNQQSDSWKHAIEHAQALTQTTPLGITNWISKLKHSQDSHVAVRVAARVLAPFVTIPTNVALSALRRLPVTGDLAAVSRLLDYKDGSVHFHPEKVTHEIARALLRWGLYATASSFLFGNDKNGKSRVTGYAPQGHDFRGDGVFVHAPHAITAMGHTFDLNRLGIVGKALAGMKDFHDGKLKEGLIEAGKEEALVRPFMDLYYANKFGSAGWGAYVANHLPIPSFMGQLGRAFEDKEKLSYNPADDGKFWAAVGDTAAGRAGFNQNPDVKLGGTPVEKPHFDDSILTRMYRLLSPAQLRPSDDFYSAKGKKIVKEKVR